MSSDERKTFPWPVREATPNEKAELLEKTGEKLESEHSHSCPINAIGKGLKKAAQGIRIQEARSSTGPAQVASAAYRDGWESLFGKKTEAGKA